jgi:hypothetical protein
MDLVPSLGMLSEALKLAREASNLAKDSAALEADIREKKIVEAGEQLQKSVENIQAQIGLSFGYQLCKCSLPPKVCLKISHDAETLLKYRSAQVAAKYIPFSSRKNLNDMGNTTI